MMLTDPAAIQIGLNDASAGFRGRQEDMDMIMIVVGALLLAVAAVVSVTAVVTGSDSVAVEVFNVDLELTTWGAFVAGVVTGVVVLAGIAALVIGVRQVQARRHEIEELRRKVAMLEGGEPTAEADEQRSDGRADQPFDQSRESDSRPANMA